MSGRHLCVMRGRGWGVAPGVRWVKASLLGDLSSCTVQPQQQRRTQPQMSVVPRLRRNPAWRHPGKISRSPNASPSRLCHCPAPAWTPRSLSLRSPRRARAQSRDVAAVFQPCVSLEQALRAQDPLFPLLNILLYSLFFH